MIYIGIDPGVNPVFALLFEDNTVTLSKILTRTHAEYGFDAWWQEHLRMCDLGVRLNKRLGRWGGLGDIVFGLEGLAFGAAYRVALMSKIDFVIKHVILQRQYKLVQVAPGTWKKFVGGSGRASKLHVKQCLVGRGYVSLEDKSLDYSDALAIALTTRSLYEQSIVGKRLHKK